MKSWNEESEDYRRQKLDDGGEIAWLLAILMLVAICFGLLHAAFESWVKPWLTR